MNAAFGYRRHYTVNEYFALEEANVIRHDYHHSELIPPDGPLAMAGAPFAHHPIKQNGVIGLRAGLRGSGCKVLDESVRTEVEAAGPYTFPDVVVTSLGLPLPLAAIYDEVELGPLRVWRAE